MGSRWDRDGIAMGSRRDIDGIAMGSRWDIDGIAMGYRWDIDGIAMGPLTDRDPIAKCERIIKGVQAVALSLVSSTTCPAPSLHLPQSKLRGDPTTIQANPSAFHRHPVAIPWPSRGQPVANPRPSHRTVLSKDGPSSKRGGWSCSK